MHDALDRFAKLEALAWVKLGTGFIGYILVFYRNGTLQLPLPLCMYKSYFTYAA